MFEIFGEFNSLEELNEAAEGQKQEGDKEALLKLAKENGIDEEDAIYYFNGEMERFTSATMAVLGRIKVEEEEIGTDKMKQMIMNVIITMLKIMCSDEEMQAAVIKKGKRIEKIYIALKEAASKHKTGNSGCACGTDRELKEIIRAYYLGSEKELKDKIESLYKE